MSVAIRSSSVCLKELSLTRHQTKMAGKETLSRTEHVDGELQLQLSELESIFMVIILILTMIDGKAHTLKGHADRFHHQSLNRLQTRHKFKVAYAKSTT